MVTFPPLCLVEGGGGRWSPSPPQFCLDKTRGTIKNSLMCMSARSKDKRMKTREGGRDGTKVRVAAMKGEPSAQAQPKNQTSLSEPGRPETRVESKLCACMLRAVARARERKE